MRSPLDPPRRTELMRQATRSTGRSRLVLGSRAVVVGVAAGSLVLVGLGAGSAAAAGVGVGSYQLSVIAGTGTAGAPTPGPATSSNLSTPAGVAVDGTGNVYIADNQNNLVEKVNTSGTLSVIAGTGTAGAPTPGPATSSNLRRPFGVAVDGVGNVYIGDTGNNRVEKIDTSGTLSVIAGTGTAGAPTPGPATSSNLRNPYGVAVDGVGNVYIADANNRRVEKIDTSGTLSVIAGTGTAGAPTPGPATSSNLRNPFGVAVDGAGNVYIADTHNNQVEKIDTSGTLSVIAGTGTAGAPTPGPATSSNLNTPVGVAVDGAGNAYLADAFNNQVEKIDTSGTLSVIAGTGTTGAPTPGPATSSNLNTPVGVAVDGAGNVYIGDATNNRVEQLVPFPDAPGQPTVVVGDSSVTVTVAPTVGAPVSSYTVTSSPSTKTCTVAASARPLSCTVTGLTNGTAYTFTVTATNAAGTSAPSVASNPVVPHPVAPQRFATTTQIAHHGRVLYLHVTGRGHGLRSVVVAVQRRGRGHHWVTVHHVRTNRRGGAGIAVDRAGIYRVVFAGQGPWLPSSSVAVRVH